MVIDMNYWRKVLCNIMLEFDDFYYEFCLFVLDIFFVFLVYCYVIRPQKRQGSNFLIEMVNISIQFYMYNFCKIRCFLLSWKISKQIAFILLSKLTYTFTSH